MKRFCDPDYAILVKDWHHFVLRRRVGTLAVDQRRGRKPATVPAVREPVTALDPDHRSVQSIFRLSARKLPACC